MSFNWKKSAIVLTDCILACYVLLAVTAFNHPDESSDVCTKVNIHIEEGIAKGFLTAEDIKIQLQRAKIYPLGDLMNTVDVRKIEEALNQNPFVKSAQCYKTQSGRINITLKQRMPVIRVKAANGEDYYLDEQGNMMPNTHIVSNMIIATGTIQRKYAQKVLLPVGRYLMQHPLWGNQVEQLNVLDDQTIELVPRVGNHIVYLGNASDLDRKLLRLEKFYKYGLSKAGWNKYSYINIEFDNQIICKKQ